MIRIPPRLNDLLEQNRDLQTAVNASLNMFEPWLESGGKRPTFFPDYTDHSVQHIEEVLGTAVSLIRDEAWGAFTAADAAVLVLAVVLHDSAMHLTREGFEALVRPGTSWTPIPDFGDKPWPQLWATFVLEARRFDHRRLIALFGDREPIEVPDLDDLRLDDKSRRLIGEFVRRHHPRLAHEIARHGIPGVAGLRPRTLEAPAKIADLAGLVARSHGLPARACLPYLKKNYGSRTDPLGVHAVFLIVLLRIADYLQLQSSRAPAATQQVHRIHSPYSKIEWRIHASVTDIRESEEDPEAIVVIAEPPDIETYLRLNDWLGGLQAEVDVSWAVLGEIYSRQKSKGLDSLGIRVRRIYSSLGTSDFASRVDYLPRRVAFATANADILKLLIGPLYGERPEIGVRELIQNAVDAVRELRALQERGVVPRDVELSAQEADVVVSLTTDCQDAWWLEVSDRGVGMTADVICAYFLTAGATLRTSDAWRAAFLDAQSRSTVIRSGRFGIGAFASFLLGDQLHVTTRSALALDNALDKKGFSFSAQLDTDPIEVRSFERPVGTTVRIKLHTEAAKRLLGALAVSNPGSYGDDGERQREDVWDWYCLNDPSVVRVVGPEAVRLGQRIRVPGPGEATAHKWHRVIIPDYEDVQWTRAPAPGLICNGIKISDHPVWTFRHDANFSAPQFSIFDSDGKLPLKLARDGVTSSDCPFEREFLNGIWLDFVASTLCSLPSLPPHRGADARSFLPPDFASPHGYAFWSYYRNGLVPCLASSLWELNLNSAFVLPMVTWGESLRVPSNVEGLSVDSTRITDLHVPTVDLGMDSAVVYLRQDTGTWLGSDAAAWEAELRHVISSGAPLPATTEELFETLVWHAQRLYADEAPTDAILRAYQVVGYDVYVRRELATRMGHLVQRRNPAAVSSDIGNQHVFSVRRDQAPPRYGNSISHVNLPALPVVRLYLARRDARPAGSRMSDLYHELWSTRPLPHDPELRAEFASAGGERLGRYLALYS